MSDPSASPSTPVSVSALGRRLGGPVSRRRMLAIAGGGVIACAAAGGTTACATTPATTRLDAIRRRGRIRVAIAGEVPYGYISADGRLTGAFPEIVRAAMARFGHIDIEPISVEFDDLIAGAIDDRFDVIAAGLVVTSARCSEVRFGRPEVAVRFALAVAPGNPFALVDLGSVAATPAVRLGVLAGAIELDEAHAAGVPDAQIVQLSRTGELVTNLVARRVDAFVLTSRSVSALQAGAAPGAFDITPSFTTVVDAPPAPHWAALAYPPGDDNFVSDMEAVLEPLRVSGAVAQILQRFTWPVDEILPAGQPFACG